MTTKAPQPPLTGRRRRACPDGDGLCRQAEHADEMGTTFIRDVMTTPAATVTTQCSTDTALSLMRSEQISSIPVVDNRGALIGVISETVLLHDKVPADRPVPVSAGRVSGTTPRRRVADAMTHHIVTVGPDQSIEVAIELMRSTTLDHLPVVEKDRVVGTVGREDLNRLHPPPDRCYELESSAGTACRNDAGRLDRNHG